MFLGFINRHKYETLTRKKTKTFSLKTFINVKILKYLNKNPLKRVKQKVYNMGAVIVT